MAGGGVETMHEMSISRGAFPADIPLTVITLALNSFCRRGLIFFKVTTRLNIPSHVDHLSIILRV